MRPLRVLQSGVWYEVRTRINNREPVFRRPKALALFAQVFRETQKRFVFQIRGLCLTDDRLTFYIKPEDGLQLPAIMKWLKQVFAQRYNRAEDREGHIWGDRYGSRILAGEPPATCRGEAPAGLKPLTSRMVREYGAGTRVSPQYGKIPPIPPFLCLFPLHFIPAPA
ncbi:MAG: transposase [Spirochaetaceae bacterium]|jgi:REP element-mobilizing transposase RayT|nr:transposase [Spirochaetaceae bacterium]